jgi:hypothetical protein
MNKKKTLKKVTSIASLGVIAATIGITATSCGETESDPFPDPTPTPDSHITTVNVDKTEGDYQLSDENSILRLQTVVKYSKGDTTIYISDNNNPEITGGDTLLTDREVIFDG